MEKPKAREPYEKPLIQRIRMVAEELAVTGCKTRTSPTGPTAGCYKAMCRTLGS